VRVGPYEIVRELGRGSMGAVYVARRPDLDRLFALKVMSRSILADREAVLRFKQEARLASRIDHPGVVQVVDVGDVEGAPYYVMTLCEGETLQELLRRGPLEEKRATGLARDLADAVAAAHAQGCIHRDLKPANVIMDPASGRPRITDFGLAQDTRANERLTRTGEILGTPYYMAPEQLEGARDVDGRADVYALGVILYECLSASRPYEAPSTALLAGQIREGKSTPLRARVPGVPAPLEEIVQRAIANDRERRIPTAAALRDGLDRYLDGGSRGSSSARAELAPPPLSGTTIALLVVAGAFLLATVLITAIVLHQNALREEEARVRRAEEDARKRDADERARREAAETARRRAVEEEAQRKARESLTGFWNGDYGPNGIEKIEIRQQGNEVTATKVTGDDWVPAGEVTWRATLDGKTGEGQGQIADKGHKNARLVPGRLTVLDEDHVSFEWIMEGNQGFPVFYTRLPR
jgi:hypothetical protein